MGDQNIIVIGVAGGTGSGKTTLVKALMNRFGENITVLSHDNYYKQHNELTYDFTVHNRTEGILHIEPEKVIVVEGILIFQDLELCREMDIKIFVDTDADVRLCRRIRRDVRKRGRTIESVIDQYLTTVKPMHEQFVEPSKKNADLIVPEGGKNLIALEMIVGRIQRHIEQH